MSSELAANESFSEEIPGLQTAWDSTSFGMLKSCPRKYELMMVQQWRPKKMAGALRFGILFHTAMELYEEELAHSKDKRKALRACLRNVMSAAGEYKDGEFLPWTTDDNKRNPYTLARAITWYFDHYQNDPAETITLDNGLPAVELSFKIPLAVEAPTGEQYVICGHIDRMARCAGNTWVVDYKTTTKTLGDSYYRQFSPHNQFCLYTMAANTVYRCPVSGVMVDAVQLAVGFTRFGRHMVMFTKGQLDEWFANTLRYIKVAEEYAMEERWPMNEESCHHWGGCRFREVCSKDPASRQNFLEADFHREPWDPMQNR